MHPDRRDRGAMLSGPEKVDFIFRNRVRVRAQFDERLPGARLLRGFYLQPRGDQLCAGRDAIHSRMGASCTIERFRMLEPSLDRERPCANQAPFLDNCRASA